MLPKVGGGNGTTKDDILRDPKRIGRRIRGWRQPALDVIPETTAWYTTTAPVSDYDAGYNGEGSSEPVMAVVALRLDLEEPLESLSRVSRAA